MAEIENEIFSTNTPMKEKAISSERRAVDFVPAFQSKHDIRQVVEKFREKVFAHNLDQNTTEQGKPSESEVVDKPSEKQVHEESSTAGEQSRKVAEKFHEKVFQSAHNLNQNTTEQGEPSESEVVDKNIAGLAEKRGGTRGDSNEDESFNETDFESSHHNDQNLGEKPKARESEPSEKALEDIPHSVLWTKNVAVLLPKRKPKLKTNPHGVKLTTEKSIQKTRHTKFTAI